MRNLFPPISDMRFVIRSRLFQSLVAVGIVPNPQDQFGKSKPNDKSLDTAKEKLVEFMKGPWLAFQKLVRTLDSPRASVEVAWVIGTRNESTYVDFHCLSVFFLLLVDAYTLQVCDEHLRPVAWRWRLVVRRVSSLIRRPPLQNSFARSIGC